MGAVRVVKAGERDGLAWQEVPRSSEQRSARGARRAGVGEHAVAATVARAGAATAEGTAGRVRERGDADADVTGPDTYASASTWTGTGGIAS